MFKVLGPLRQEVNIPKKNTVREEKYQNFFIFQLNFKEDAIAWILSYKTIDDKLIKFMCIVHTQWW